jgi:hypothetical protein
VGNGFRDEVVQLQVLRGGVLILITVSTFQEIL